MTRSTKVERRHFQHGVHGKAAALTVFVRVAHDGGQRDIAERCQRGAEQIKRQHAAVFDHIRKKTAYQRPRFRALRVVLSDMDSSSFGLVGAGMPGPHVEGKRSFTGSCGPPRAPTWWLLGGGVTFRCWFTRRNWFWRRCGPQNLVAAGAHKAAVGLLNAAVPQCGRFLRFCLAAAASVGFVPPAVQVAVSLISWKSWVCGSGVGVGTAVGSGVAGTAVGAAVGTAVGTGVGACGHRRWCRRHDRRREGTAAAWPWRPRPSSRRSPRACRCR